QRIPVSWSGISIVEGEKGKDYGCITEGEVKAQGSNGTVVTNDLERQITSLLSSGPGSYSGKFGEALEAMKAKAQELLDKIANGDKPTPDDYKSYNNICKAVDKGIDIFKNDVNQKVTDPSLKNEVTSVLNELDEVKTALLTQVDCEGVGYNFWRKQHNAFDTPQYASTNNKLIPTQPGLYFLFSPCKLNDAGSNASKIKESIDKILAINKPKSLWPIIPSDDYYLQRLADFKRRYPNVTPPKYYL
ncbi:hypothetical protein, partial [Pseudarcicella hirudinis]